MNFDRDHDGPQGATSADEAGGLSRFAEVREAIFANTYYRTWGEGTPLPVYEVTLARTLRGILPFGPRWKLLQAARRTVGTRADMRWGADGRGFRRLLHPNGVCLFGSWEIDEAYEGSPYTGYFRPGARGLIVGRYSTCCTETRRGRYRSLSLVGKIYPTIDPDHLEPTRTANFFTQQDLGGEKTKFVKDAILRNAPDTTPWRRGAALPVLLLSGVAFGRANPMPTMRQLYEIAELGKPEGEPTRSPSFLRLRVVGDARATPGKDLDFRDEILDQIYDPGDPRPRRTLTFEVAVSDDGYSRGLLVQRVKVRDWRPIGRIVFHEAAASYNGDFVVHFPHPPWRTDRDDPRSVDRSRERR
ncbi:hypothetical protein [Planctomyces sp. SH-PL62]|uniref:hypothetical protein n=1 Tax=Planctomyces sp. SH-PL62 TaxID=1636152 RepID=UPI00078C7280|nr:hypothetical protein [Planctomyces sp. SH-PL62]AMV39721.1 hypothetical protein VT85_19975 [Planctomyces sp. SH-PL62]